MGKENSELSKKEAELNNLRLRLKVLERVTEVASDIEDFRKVLSKLLDLAVEITSTEAGSILLRKGDYVVIEAAEGPKAGLLKDLKLPLGKGIAGWVAKTGVPLLSNDVKKDERWDNRIAEAIQYETRNILCLPIKSRTDVIGVLELINKRNEKDFVQDDLDISLLFTSFLAKTIENSSLLLEMNDRIKELSILTETSTLISSTLDLKELLHVIMRRLKEVMKAEASSIFQIDEETNELYFVVATGEKGAEAKEIRVPWGKGIVGWTAEKGKTLNVPDVTKDKRFFTGVDKKTKWETRSILAVPLRIKGKVIGVAEVLNKIGDEPFDDYDERLFEAISRQAAVAIDNARLYTDLSDLFKSSIRTLVNTVEAKDKYTRGHTERVTEYSVMIAEQLNLPQAEIQRIELSALLHDVGKIGIPDKILLKPGKLTKEEYEVVKEHPARGVKIMKPIKQLSTVLDGIKYHHEWLNGNGYPDGLKNDEIPLVARIITIGDAYDAMTTDRPYRKALSKKEAIRRLKKDSTTQFDPELVDVFLKCLKKEK
ncbi:MAG: GAF domain-containing protein [Candidatus Cloacimonadota bacterium]|nr:MAG: GAF domain-containing protein [Candidatus Cloacimonadota bacterium]